MRELNKDEPAYPRSYTADGHNGMSLRDWFAGQVGAASVGGLLSAQISTSEEDTKLIAKAAYMFADAMLEERKK